MDWSWRTCSCLRVVVGALGGGGVRGALVIATAFLKTNPRPVTPAKKTTRRFLSLPKSSRGGNAWILPSGKARLSGVLALTRAVQNRSSENGVAHLLANSVRHDPHEFHLGGIVTMRHAACKT